MSMRGDTWGLSLIVQGQIPFSKTSTSNWKFLNFNSFYFIGIRHDLIILYWNKENFGKILNSFCPLEEWGLVLFLRLSSQSESKICILWIHTDNITSRVVVANIFGSGFTIFLYTVALTVLFSHLLTAASTIVQLFQKPEKITLEILTCLKWIPRL